MNCVFALWIVYVGKKLFIGVIGVGDQTNDEKLSMTNKVFI